MFAKEQAVARGACGNIRTGLCRMSPLGQTLGSIFYLRSIFGLSMGQGTEEADKTPNLGWALACNLGPLSITFQTQVHRELANPIPAQS